ncbi:2-dehydro-3-deoxyphosphooctonate aldolase [Aquimarina sp. 433]
MKTKLLITFILFSLFSCSTTKNVSKNVKQTLLDDNTFVITEISSDPSYGLSPKNPIEVGSEDSGPKNERRYLNALSGPNGEAISYYRLGSCCPIKSDKAIFGNKVMLDNYRVTWEGSKDTISIYINMYDSGKLMAPKGFGIRKN